VLNIKAKDELTDETEKLRKELLSISDEITIRDFGAGAANNAESTKKVKDIVKNSAKSRKYASLLYRIFRYYNVRKALELGTSAGISSMYMASAMPHGRLITVEGSPEIAKLALENFNRIGFKNISQVVGNFDDVLKEILQKEQSFDCVFFDGNHREEATLRYFEQCLPFVHNDTVFIFDDINWSGEMKRAWQNIKEHSSVRVTIDLYFLGIVFFRKELSKENFVIRF